MLNLRIKYTAISGAFLNLSIFPMPKSTGGFSPFNCNPFNPILK